MRMKMSKQTKILRRTLVCRIRFSASLLLVWRAKVQGSMLTVGLCCVACDAQRRTAAGPAAACVEL